MYTRASLKEGFVIKGIKKSTERSLGKPGASRGQVSGLTRGQSPKVFQEEAHVWSKDREPGDDEASLKPC